MLFRASFPNIEPILLPGKNELDIPQHDNIYLRDLLANILKRNPKNRLNADELCAHFYFTNSIIQKYQHSGKIVPTEYKLKSFQRFLHHFKKNQSRQLLHRIVRRNNLVNDVLNIFIDITQ